MPELFRRPAAATAFDQSDFSGISGLRGITLDPAALSGGSVELNARGVLAQGSGMARLGEGIANAGGAMMQVAEEQARAIAIRQEADAENEMADIEGKIQVAMAGEPDESKWNGIRSELVGALEENISGREMMATARDAVRMKMSGWKNRVGHFVGMASARRSVERARESISARAQRMMDAGDYAGLGTMLNQSGTAHLMGEDWVAGQQGAAVKHAEVQAQKAQWAAEYQNISADPDAYLAEHGKPRPNESPEEHSRRINAAQELSRDAFRAKSEGLADMLANPDLSPAELESALEGLPDREAAKWKAAYSEMRQDALKTERAKPENINEAWAMLDEAVQAFDRTAPDAREQYTKIRGESITLLPEGWRQHILAQLDGKWSGKALDIAESTKAEILDAVDATYKEGGFGAVTRPQEEGQDPATQEWEPVKPGKVYFKKRTVQVDLPEEEKKAARARKAGVKTRMLEILKQNPDLTPEEAFQQLDGIKKGKRMDAAPSMRFGSAPAPDIELPATRRRMTGITETDRQSLPDTPGPVENTLIPFSAPSLLK